MEQRWPECAKTREDVVLFFRTMLSNHRGSQQEDLSGQLTSWYSRQFDEKTSTKKTADFSSYLMQSLNVRVLEEMPILFEEIYQLRMDTERAQNSQNPIKSVQIGGGSAVHYMSTSVLGNNCSCNITFGAEKLKQQRLIQHVQMYAAEKHMINMRLQNLLRDQFFPENKSWYKHNCFSV